MREAMLLARLSALEGEVPVGAVVTRAGGIVGRGRNRRETGKNALAMQSWKPLLKRAKHWAAGGFGSARSTSHWSPARCAPGRSSMHE